MNKVSFTYNTSGISCKYKTTLKLWQFILRNCKNARFLVIFYESFVSKQFLSENFQRQFFRPKAEQVFLAFLADFVYRKKFLRPDKTDYTKSNSKDCFFTNRLHIQFPFKTLQLSLFSMLENFFFVWFIILLIIKLKHKNILSLSGILSVIGNAEGNRADQWTTTTEQVQFDFSDPLSVTRLGDLLDFGYLFKAFGSNLFAQISLILGQFL